MDAYRPTSMAVALAVVGILVITLALGLPITRLLGRRAGRPAAWMLVAASATSMDRITVIEPAGLRMLAICGAVLFAMKAVVGVEESPSPPRLRDLGAWRWLCFAAAWPGMDPASFVRAPAATPTATRLVGAGLRRLALGVALILLARVAWTLTGSRVLATALVLPGLSLALHFGAFQVLAGVWRSLGADTDRLFVAPLAAKNLGEFWGRRWNLAFSEMTRATVYRPLAPHVGRGAATTAAFLFSGLLHELAISVPVRAGFGLPLLYFALHGGAMSAEKALARRGRPIEAWGWLAHAWTLAWLALPMPILFHPPFLRGVVWPLIGIHG